MNIETVSAREVIENDFAGLRQVNSEKQFNHCRLVIMQARLRNEITKRDANKALNLIEELSRCQ